MYGRVFAKERDVGGFFLVGSRTAVTAGHCVRDVEPGDLSFRTADGGSFGAEAVEADDALDVAAVTLDRDAQNAGWVDDVEDGDRWKVLVSPALDDPLIGGVVSSARREYLTSRGAPVGVMQLTVDEDLGQFRGYSGSAVALPGRDGAVCGVLIEQQPQRFRAAGQSSRASNVLYAIPIRDVLDRFGLQAGAAARPSLPWDVPIDTLVAANRGSPDRPLPFGGRDEELARLDDWLTDEEGPRRLVVSAPAGGGKTTLLIHWIQQLQVSNDARLGDVATVFVPISLTYDISTRAAVLGAMVSRVGRVYGRRMGTERSAQDLQADLASLLRMPPPRRLLVVVDALDETLGWDIGPGLLPHDIHPLVRTAVSARTTADNPTARAWASRLGWDPSQTLDLDLDRLSADGVLQVLTAHADLAPVASSQVRPLADAVHEASDGGDPLLVRLYVDEIGDSYRNRGALPSADDIDVTPRGLESHIDRWWTDLRRQWRESGTRPSPHAGELFSLLAVARSFLTRGEAIQALRWLPGQDARIDSDVLDEAVLGLRRFIAPVADDLALTHPRLSAARRHILERDGELERFESAFRAWGASVIASLDSGVGGDQPVKVPEYLLRYLGEHLRPAPPEELLPLASTQWRAAWEARADRFRGHRDDHDRVKDALRKEAAREVGNGLPVTTLPAIVAVRAAAADDELESRLATPELVAAAVGHGVWTPGRAIGYVRGVESAEGRAQALGLIAPLTPQLDDREVVDVLTSVSGAVDPEFAKALSGCCARLAGLGRLSDAVTLAGQWRRNDEPRDFAKAWAYCQLLPHVADDTAEGLLQQILDVGRHAGRNHAPQLLSQLEYHLPIERARALLGEDPVDALRARWSTASREDWRDHVASRMPEWLPDTERHRRQEQRLAALGQHDWDYLDLLELAPHLPDALVPMALATGDRLNMPKPGRLYIRLLAGAKGNNRATVECRLSPELPAMRTESGGGLLDQDLADLARLGMPGQALEIVVGRSRPGERKGPLQAVSPHLTEALVRKALPTAVSEASEGRSSGLSALLARLASFGPGQASEAFRLLRNLSGGWDQAALAWAFGAAHLPMNTNGAADWSRLGDASAVAATTGARAGIGALSVPDLTIALEQLHGKPALCWPVLSLASSAGVLDGAEAAQLDELRDAVIRRLRDAWSLPRICRHLPSYVQAVAQAVGVEAAVALFESLPPQLSGIPAISVQQSLTPGARTSVQQLVNRLDTTKGASGWDGGVNAWNLAMACASLGDRTTFLAALDIAGDYTSALAAPLLRHLPEEWRATAAQRIVPKRFFDGFNGETSPQVGEPFDDLWAGNAVHVIEALNTDQLAELMELVEKVKSASSRQELRGAAAVRWAQCGEVEKALHAARFAFDPPEALAEVGASLDAEALPEWVATVAEALSGSLSDADRMRAWSGAAARWREVDTTIRWRSAERWLDAPAPEGRRGLACDVVGLAPCLTLIGDNRTAQLLPKAAKQSSTIGLLRELSPSRRSPDTRGEPDRSDGVPPFI